MFYYVNFLLAKFVLYSLKEVQPGCSVNAVKSGFIYGKKDTSLIKILLILFFQMFRFKADRRQKLSIVYVCRLPASKIEVSKVLRKRVIGHQPRIQESC